MAEQWRPQFVVIIQHANGDLITIGPFDTRPSAQAEAARWDPPEWGSMVRYLWAGDDLRRDMAKAGQAAKS